MSNRPNPKPPSRRPSSGARPATSSGARVEAAATGSRTPLWIGAGVAVLVLGCLLIAIIVSSRGSETPALSDKAAASGATVVPVTGSAIPYGTVKVEGTPLVEQPEAGADPAIGKPAPALVGQQFDGSALTIPASGTPKIVMFVAHWCPHCQKEVPLLTSHLNADGLPKGVALFTVATGTRDDAANYPPGAWLQREGWIVPTLVDDKVATAAKAYGLSGYPYFVVVDAAGNVVTRASGELTTAQFDALVEAARTGKAPATLG